MDNSTDQADQSWLRTNLAFYTAKIFSGAVLGVPGTTEGWDAEEDACTEDQTPPGVLFHMALHFSVSCLPF